MMGGEYRPCPCGSGELSRWARDARGIVLCRVCPKCEKEKLARYRPEVLDDPEYETTEAVGGGRRTMLETTTMMAYILARGRGLAPAAALAAARARPACAGWTSFRGAWHGQKCVSRQPDRPRYAWIENTEAAGLRFVDYADCVARLGHTGWYVDEFRDDKYRGAVYRLPHTRGLVAGYADPCIDGAAFVELEPLDPTDLVGAARAADSIADHEAEREREWREREAEAEGSP